MLAITHVVVSVLLIHLLTLDRNDAFVALLFGVFIDLDHLLGLGGYVQSKGVVGLFDTHSLMNPGGQWKSMLHNPISLGVVAPISVGWRFAIPLLFWGVHLSMDWAEENVLGNFSVAEMLLVLMAGTLLVAIRFSKFTGEDSSIGGFIRHELAELRATVLGKPSSSSA